MLIALSVGCSPFSRPFTTAEGAWEAVEKRCRNIRTDSEVSTFDYPALRLPRKALGFALECAGSVERQPTVWIGQVSVQERHVARLLGEEIASEGDHIWRVEDRMDALRLANRASQEEGFEPCYSIEHDRVVMPRGLCCEGYRLPLYTEIGVASLSCGDSLRSGLIEAYGRKDLPGWHPERDLVVSTERVSIFGVHDASAPVRELSWPVERDLGPVYPASAFGWYFDEDPSEPADTSLPVVREAPMWSTIDDLEETYGYSTYILEPDCLMPGARHRFEKCRVKPPLTVRLARTGW